MKRLLVLFLFIAGFSHILAQSDTVFIKYNSGWDDDVVKYKTDTVLFDTPFKRKILYGTTVLPWTSNQMFAKGFGLDLDSVSIRECEQGIEGSLGGNDKIVAVRESEDSLQIDIDLQGNCCHSFLCDVQILDEQTINLLAYGYGTHCACSCLYAITFYFSKTDFSDFEKLQDIIIDGNTRTRRKIR